MINIRILVYIQILNDGKQ